MEIDKELLLRITSTLMLDFYKWKDRLELDDNNLTVADIRNYCRDWISENLKQRLLIDEKKE